VPSELLKKDVSNFVLNVNKNCSLLTGLFKTHFGLPKSRRKCLTSLVSLFSTKDLQIIASAFAQALFGNQ